MSVLLNDVHSRMNSTWVREVVTPESLAELQLLVRQTNDAPISIAGGMHAMGGQQFGQDAVHIDTRTLHRVLEFDPIRGLVRAEAGIQWPGLIAGIREHHQPGDLLWGIRQKQTGASDLTLGGALSANAHGRGLRMAPFISDVESFRLVDYQGEVLECSRTKNQQLFALVIGGYGLFGVIYDVTLRLSPRTKVQRCVDLESIDNMIDRFEQEVDMGTLYGDFQFAIDDKSDDFLHRGIFSRYRCVDSATPIPPNQIYFSEERWLALLRLARTKKTEAYHRYAEFYASTNGQIYDSDTHQISTYVPRYHDRLADLPEWAQGSEVISEVYVPLERLIDFMNDAKDVLRRFQAPLTYGTLRWIREDTESFLVWARRDYACIIFNLLTPNTQSGRDRTAGAFRALYDLALQRDGSFFLTYHSYASAAQVNAAYPQMAEFLRRKRERDPQERFQSNWYRHMKSLIGV